MLIIPLLIVICGIVYMYSNPYEKVRIHEYQGWLIYIHAARFGLLIGLASFFFWEMAFTAIYTILYYSYVFMLKLEVCNHMKCSFIPLSSLLDYTPIKAASHLVSRLLSTNGSDISKYAYLISFSLFSLASTYAYKAYLKTRYSKQYHKDALYEQYRTHSPLDTIIIDAYLTESYVLVTMSNGKVYAGIPTSTPTTSSEKELIKPDIKLIMLESGYRDSKTQDYVRTNDYDSVYSASQTGPMPSIVLSRSSIVNISNFEPEIYYKAFQKKKQPEGLLQRFHKSKTART